jgi:hypothetical protein
MIHVVSFNKQTPKDAVVVNTTSRSNTWSIGLSPFFLGPVKLYGNFTANCVENGWQYSKCFSYYLDDGEPGERYFNWAKDGWSSKRANRYPMGKGIVPEYSYWDGEKLSYIEARKKIYIPLYSNAVRNTLAYKCLEDAYHNNEDLYLQDFDAHSLIPGSFKYEDLWNNPNIKVGHAYVLAMMLEKII